MAAKNEPVLIPLKNDSGDELPCWAMLEINGELIPPKDIENSELLELGSLRFDKNIPTMIIGNHELKGKLEDLANPYCVLQKSQSEYNITGIVKSKILFNQYPKTIMLQK